MKNQRYNGAMKDPLGYLEKTDNMEDRSVNSAIHDLGEEIASLAGCCMPNPAFHGGDIERVLAYFHRFGDDPWVKWNEDSEQASTYIDSESYAVVLLKDGLYGMLYEASDSTGHGCQCLAHTAIFSSLLGLVQFGLGKAEREHFKSVYPINE